MQPGTARSQIILTVDESVCFACRKCLGARVCTTNALRIIDPGEPPYIDASLCRGCLACMRVCPSGAIVRVEAGGNGNGSVVDVR